MLYVDTPHHLSKMMDLMSHQLSVGLTMVIQSMVLMDLLILRKRQMILNYFSQVIR